MLILFGGLAITSTTSVVLILQLLKNTPLLLLEMFVLLLKLLAPTISNGSRTEWSPIQSVIIGALNKTGPQPRGSPIRFVKI